MHPKDFMTSLEVAITAAIDYCIDENILTDILTKCRAEVFDMLLTEYDAKFHEKCVHEDGIEKGRTETLTAIAINALNNGMTESEISTKLLIPPGLIEAAKKEMLSIK